MPIEASADPEHISDHALIFSESDTFNYWFEYGLIILKISELCELCLAHKSGAMKYFHQFLICAFCWWEAACLGNFDLSYMCDSTK